MSCLRPTSQLLLGTAAGILICLVAALVPNPLQAAGPEESPPLDFNRDIRPILADNCYACHGPDQNQRMAGLRLDSRDSALGRLDSGNPAIVPGNPEESQLIRRITAENEALRMPPAYSGKELNRRQIDLLTRWIRQGAPWSKHWAYVRPERPPLPKVADTSWPANGIDHFILARLEREGIGPSPEADRRTLIRRLTFDLTGLPPTVREVENFLSDGSPQAYERLVDRLLASPHFGERMAMHWLDLARYADSDGYHVDFPRSMWKYRDWVIAAFNANKPFDRFTVEQLAGDLLPDPTLDQKIATAFNRNGMTSTEGGADAKEYLSKYVIDRVNTTTTVWLGSTVACAECHDHKFDPFTQQEYYRLYDFFHQIPEKGLDRDPAPPYLWLPSEEQRSRLSQLERTIRTLESSRQARLDMTHDGLDEAQAEWEEELARIHRTRRELELKEWSMIGPFIAQSAEEAFSRSFPPESELDLSQSYQDGKLSWNARPDWKDGEAQPLLGTKAATYLHRRILAESARKLKFFVATNAPYADGLKVWLNGQLVLAKAVEGCEPAKSIEVQVDLRSGANDLLLKAVNYGGGYGFYFSLDAPLEDKALMQVMTAAAKPVLERDGAEKTALRHYFREHNSPRLQALGRQLSRLRKEKEELEQGIPTVRVMEDMEYRRPTHVLIRGDYRSKGEQVSAGVPEFLPSLPPGERSIAWPWPAGWSTPTIRWWAESPSTASGSSSSAPESCEPPMNSALRASRLLTPGCWTGWLGSSWTGAGTSSPCSRPLRCRPPTGNLPGSARIFCPGTPPTGCWPEVPGCGCPPRPSGTTCWPSAACWTGTAPPEGRASIPISLPGSGRTRPFTAAPSTSRAREKTSTAAACTPSGSARCPIPSCKPLTHPTARSAPSAGSAP